MVRAIDALERKKLVVRRRGPDNIREVVLTLTAEGQQMRVALARARRERVVRLLRAMTKAEVEALLVGYEGLAQAIEIVDTTERDALALELRSGEGSAA